MLLTCSPHAFHMLPTCFSHASHMLVSHLACASRLHISYTSRLHLAHTSRLHISLTSRLHISLTHLAESKAPPPPLDTRDDSSSWLSWAARSFKALFQGAPFPTSHQPHDHHQRYALRLPFAYGRALYTHDL